MQFLHPSLPEQRFYLVLMEHSSAPNAVVLGGNVVKHLGWSPGLKDKAGEWHLETGCAEWGLAGVGRVG